VASGFSRTAAGPLRRPAPSLHLPMRDDWESLATPVLVIGAGAAGLRAAIELASQGVECLVLGKRAHGDAHTRWAAGGINASLGTRDPDDRWELHFADTLREAHFVCDPRAVELLCRRAPDRVRELRAWGCPFNETSEGEIDQRYFGAQSFRRTCFVGDRTGEAILAALVERARTLGVPYRANLFVTRILVDGGRATGAVGYDIESGRFVVIGATAVVLAAGGCTSVYPRSSSRSDENTGDAMVLAYDAGAVLRDMEFVQFHPTGMVDPPDMRGRLVTEAVRGEGGRLFNAAGERFMERYSPGRMELDARDVVARAIYQEITEGRGTPAGAVLLDISHREPAFIEERLPKIASQFREHGVDIARRPMEVAPTAHYAMGGVTVDFDSGATGVDGLFAVGEGTGGLHGANRLGGNSLAETLVFGQVTGAVLAEYVSRRRPAVADRHAIEAHHSELSALGRADGGEDPERLAGELRTMLWEHAGIVRTADRLRIGVEKLAELQRRAQHVSTGGPTGARFLWALNLRFMLVASEAILRSALRRDESRGAHFRLDAPREEARWQENILCARGEDGSMRLWTEPVPHAPPELQGFIAEERPLDYHLLE
jgi:succinate dehydrogenase / fumarate reductase, flavoprotein subunit